MSHLALLGAALPPPDTEFRATVELLLLCMGGAMTLALIVFVIWLIRQMLREDRESAGRAEPPARSTERRR